MLKMRTISIAGIKRKVPQVNITYVKEAGGRVLSVDVVKRTKPLKIKRLLVPITETGLGLFADNPREIVSKPSSRKLKTKPYYGLSSTTADTLADFKKNVKKSIEWWESATV